VAVLLFNLRQKDFSEAARSFEVTQTQVSDFTKETETYRKIKAAYLSQCVEVGGEAVKSCTASLLGYLSDEVDEVRWNAALGVLRAKLKDASYFHDSEIDTARSELDKLYALLKNGDTTLLSRFQGAALESLAEEVFKTKIAFSPEETKAELKEISKTHPDLRVRNVARSLAN
jgi:arginine repressor